MQLMMTQPRFIRASGNGGKMSGRFRCVALP
jgi:hypothetical protein